MVIVDQYTKKFEKALLLEAEVKRMVRQMAASISPTQPKSDDIDAAIFRTITKRQLDLSFYVISLKYSDYGTG